MNAEFAKDTLRVGQHIHQMRNRRALVARDVADAGLQQRLGDGENPLAPEHLAGAKPEVFHFTRKRAFRHAGPPCDPLLGAFGPNS